MTSEGRRRFGLAVGASFLTIAVIVWWRGRPGAASVLATLGVMLAVAGLAIPARLAPIEQAWMALAHAISKVTTPIVMGIMYFLVVTPIGFVRRLLG
ncbi:MAG TPA: SxtJ family membrane protein, partial [Vicinamibacterales bacterium]|nr:SxtJ family membrane protein [Vicinamibacterales bacterium]